ncbi:MAG TPA: sensor histidine kinase KdpD [Polyangiales bacterium]|nr:sensor histidine kinase KdpD [Polyangiales bacterium]
MNEANDRPDPDALVRRIQADAARARRGKLHVFFGFAPGVGKTYRMLQVARDLAQQQKLDVVVGIVEDHRRVETARLASELPALPRRELDYRGHTLTELDLDAVLARKPGLVLVDELAHTNAPGLRHPKRWQDVDELLEAGIDVFTTLNVQHVESLNDVVAQITGVQVRETVPDAVLDRADEIELIDISPEELLQRLREGKVYIPEQAQRASDHFFQRGNLLALRELALRRTAQHVDDDVVEYRETHGVVATWPAGERILVCVGPSPSSVRLIRAAARMAAGLRCPWVACFVDAMSVRPLTEADRTRLDEHLQAAEKLGATVAELSGTNVADVLLQYARKHNVTRIIIGKPTHARWRDRLRGSLLDELVRGSGEIDVHVIRGDSAVRAQPTAARDEPVRVRPRHYAVAAAITGVTLGLSLLLRSFFDLPDPEMLFLLAVMLTAVWFGRGPSLMAAALSVALYDLFFIPPYFTFSVADRRYVLTFATMFAVGIVLSELATRLRRQEQAASAREQRTIVLYALTRELAGTDQPAAIAAIAARHAADSFGAHTTLLVPGAAGQLRALGAAPDHLLAVAQWSFEHDALAGLGTDTLPGSDCLCAPLRVGPSVLGVLALELRDKRPLRVDQRAFLDVFCRQIAGALERARLSEEAKQAALRAQTEEVRSSLLSAVSHDLRTPLASITGAATALRDDEKLSTGTRAELLDAIVDQAERLERLVTNLLDMTRVESGAIALRCDWVPLDEMIGSALTRLEARLGERPITVSIAPDVPLLWVDPVLFEQVFVNLLENADKYTPQASALELAAHSDGERVHITLKDSGPGLPGGAESKVFEKFYRGQHQAIAGAGLGLAICKGIVEAHGGSIRASNREPTGATFSISLPMAGRPPLVSL